MRGIGAFVASVLLLIVALASRDLAWIGAGALVGFGRLGFAAAAAACLTGFALRQLSVLAMRRKATPTRSFTTDRRSGIAVSIRAIVAAPASMLLARGIKSMGVVMMVDPVNSTFVIAIVAAVMLRSISNLRLTGSRSM